jgi:hypothetical protein
MFRTQIVRGISPYALWLKKSKGQHGGVKKVADRARLVAAAYHALSPGDKAALFAEAKAIPAAPRAPRKERIHETSPFALFMQQSKSKFEATSDIKERTVMALAAFKALTPAERASLETQARKMSSSSMGPIKDKAPRVPSAYNNFVRANFDSVKGLPRTERLKVIGVKWAAHKAAQ